MFDLKFIREIKFFMFPENSSTFKSLIAMNFEIGQDRKTILHMMTKCDKMDYVKFRHLKLKLYLDEYCDYFTMNRNTNFYDF